MFHRRSLLSVSAPFVAAGGGPASYDGIVASRGVMPSHKNPSVLKANVRSTHFARGDITELSILCPNFYGVGEQAPGDDMTIKAAVEYPAGVCTQIEFSASATGTVPDGEFLLSDPLTFAIPNGERFWIRMYRECTSGLVYNFQIYTDNNAPTYSFMGDAYDDDSGVTDQTTTGAEIPNPAYQSAYHPIIIGPTTLPSVLILGDSIALGATDMATTTTPPDIRKDLAGDWGEIARTIGLKFGYFNAGVSAETAANFISNHTQRLSVLPYVTHVVVEYGVNDLFGSATAATVESRLTTIYGYLTGKTVFQTTMPPRTTSTDSWATTGNQTVISSPAGYESERVTLNTDLRASFGPAGGVFDTAAEVETSLNSGIWNAAKTDDGVHPNLHGYVDIQTSGVIDTSLIGTGATAPTDTGSGWGDKGSLFTLSSNRRSNDTATFTDNGADHSTVRGTQGHSTGLKYFELEIPGLIGFAFGVMDATTATGAGMDSFIGNLDESFGFVWDGTVYTFSGVFTGASSPAEYGTVIGGQTYRMWIDFTNGFAYAARDNVICSSGVPTSGVSGTGHVASWTPGGITLYPALSIFNSGPNTGQPVRLRTNNFLYPLLGSYSAWG